MLLSVKEVADTLFCKITVLLPAALTVIAPILFMTPVTLPPPKNTKLLLVAALLVTAAKVPISLTLTVPAAPLKSVCPVITVVSIVLAPQKVALPVILPVYVPVPTVTLPVVFVVSWPAPTAALRVPTPKTLTMPLTPPLLVTAAKLPPAARFIVPALLP
ncbi:MAG TPA: hypothetical protein LFW11_02385 [Rickettsia endosymbiont of Proechinophthirus fluctus]|nr:hypothetical protein [Rickettsia endosymbiont of Proechinophthirus fluctus]